MHTKKQGELAESLACSWLVHQGYTLIQSNFNRRVGEIDLIFKHPDANSIVFVEVRYRTDQRFGGAVASVDWQKQRKLIRTANAWLQQNVSSRIPARIDVVAVQPANRKTPAASLWLEHEMTWIVNAIES